VTEIAWNHASEDDLELYAMGRLETGRVAEFEEHLYVCDSCRDKLETAERFIMAMQGALETRVERQSHMAALLTWWKETFTVPRLATAGAVCAIALLVMAPLQDTPLTEVPLATYRSENPRPAVAPADSAFTLKPDLTGLPGDSFLLEVADANGRAIAESLVERGSATRKTVRLSGGQYWVRVYSTERALLREYALTVK
jgi:hypothetical protein